jgi:hypothetical protein
MQGWKWPYQKTAFKRTYFVHWAQFICSKCSTFVADFFPCGNRAIHAGAAAAGQESRPGGPVSWQPMPGGLLNNGLFSTTAINMRVQFE